MRAYIKSELGGLQHPVEYDYHMEDGAIGQPRRFAVIDSIEPADENPDPELVEYLDKYFHSAAVQIIENEGL